jgi:hypothetical protein
MRYKIPIGQLTMSPTYTSQEIKEITERISILRTKWLRLVETRLSALRRPPQRTAEQRETSEQLDAGSKP